MSLQKIKVRWSPKTGAREAVEAETGKKIDGTFEYELRISEGGMRANFSDGRVMRIVEMVEDEDVGKKTRKVPAHPNPPSQIGGL